MVVRIGSGSGGGGGGGDKDATEVSQNSCLLVPPIQFLDRLMHTHRFGKKIGFTLKYCYF